MSSRKHYCCKNCGKRSWDGPYRDDTCADCYQGTDKHLTDNGDYCKVCRRYMYKIKSGVDNYCFDCVGTCGDCGSQHPPKEMIVRPVDDKIRELIDQTDDVDARLGDTKNGEDFQLCKDCAREHDKLSNKKLLHCMRCHESYYDGSADGCVIEHDYDSFEGGRDGNWYTGELTCCGAVYRFHRHNSDEEASPEYCYKGEHTSDANLVEYNKKTITVCRAKDCGQQLHEAAKTAQATQEQERLQAQEDAKKKRKADWKKRIDKASNKRREARKARAAELELYDGTNSDEFDSDVDPDGCEEFDYASDSSLNPFV